MKRWIAAFGVTLAILGWHVEAQAACSYHTYVINGRMVSCSTCCYGSSCMTSCF
jgi:hypothetical protein